MKDTVNPCPAVDAQKLEDAFIKISFEEESNDASEHAKSNSTIYKNWVEKASGQRSEPDVFGADMLRKLYPNHSLVMTNDWSINVLSYPGAYSVPLNPDEFITNLVFVPFARSIEGMPGVLLNTVTFGAFRTAWDRYEFIVYIVKWDVAFGSKSQTFILHDGGDEPARAMIMFIGAWVNELHEEIWVYNQGFWRKDHPLWMEVQKADWKDVILKEQDKNAFRKDIYSFFSSEALYKQLAIPWKRGIIMYGPPGNGKTISIKALMKDMDSKGHVPLYVKSFQSWKGEEGAMADVFDHARRMAPCIVILEDLDSLINDRNRSFFLNQLDGLEGNDGLLVIGTTNHFDRLDPGLSSRPSRFDRKYYFNDPDRDERALYAIYWQGKLKDNEHVNFPDSLVAEIADLTNGFSFAYLKEAFVSALVLLLQGETKETFDDVIKKQIRTLRKELNKSPDSLAKIPVTYVNPITLPPKPEKWELARIMAISAATSLGRSFI